MKTNNLFYTFFLILIFPLLIACEDEAVAPQDETGSISPITGSDLPAEASLDETVRFTVRHIVFNGCGYYEREETKIEGKEVKVTFYAGYRDGICTMNIPTLETEYTFKPQEKGEYVFKFTGSEGNYLLDTLVVR